MLKWEYFRHIGLNIKIVFICYFFKKWLLEHFKLGGSHFIFTEQCSERETERERKSHHLEVNLYFTPFQIQLLFYFCRWRRGSHRPGNRLLWWMAAERLESRFSDMKTQVLYQNLNTFFLTLQRKIMEISFPPNIFSISIKSNDHINMTDEPSHRA